jgi:hypothetical protein
MAGMSGTSDTDKNAAAWRVTCICHDAGVPLHPGTAMAVVEAVIAATKPTGQAYVNLIGKTLDGLGEEWVAPEGKRYVVVTMRSEDAGRVPLFAETTIGLREVNEGTGSA